MSKQLQDAYIVAATRTPIGKAPRGMFNKTRPDDLLVAAIRGAMADWIARTSRSSGRVLRNMPRGALPIGVRVAATMYAS